MSTPVSRRRRSGRPLAPGLWLAMAHPMPANMIGGGLEARVGVRCSGVRRVGSFCILYSLFCILYSVFYLLSSAFRIQLDFSLRWVSCPMRLRAFVIFGVLTAGSLLADEVPIGQLPRAVQETVEMEKGDGIAKSADSYTWANTTIYKIEIDLGGVPELELHVAENGKVIRIDRLQPEKESDDEE
jgi:hypothetical protein